MCSHNLLRIEVKEIGRYLAAADRLPFLKMGTMIALFHDDGTFPSSSDAWNRNVTAGAISSATSFGSPAALCGLRFLRSLMTPGDYTRIGCMIFRLKSSDHITDVLISLHWLRVPERIQYKHAVMAYRHFKVLHTRAPSYLKPLF